MCFLFSTTGFGSITDLPDHGVPHGLAGKIMKHTNTRALYEYWNTLRGQAKAPCRDQINPGDIKWMLPGMFILEYKGEDNFPFSLAGTHMCDHYDMELRGLNMCDFWTGQDRISFSHVLQSVVEESAVGVVGVIARTNLENSCTMEMIVMPVKSPVRKPPRVMGCIAAFDTPSWQGNDREKISHQEISSLRMMWPSHYIFLVEKLFGRTELINSTVTYPQDDSACETHFLAQMDCDGIPVSMAGGAGGVGPDIVQFTIWGSEKSYKLWDWNQIFSTTGGEWQRQLSHIADARHDGYMRMLDNFMAQVTGKTHTMASFKDALSVQIIVEDILATEA